VQRLSRHPGSKQGAARSARSRRTAEFLRPGETFMVLSSRKGALGA
jgi:hypothetical protein